MYQSTISTTLRGTVTVKISSYTVKAGLQILNTTSEAAGFPQGRNLRPYVTPHP